MNICQNVSAEPTTAALLQQLLGGSAANWKAQRQRCNLWTCASRLPRGLVDPEATGYAGRARRAAHHIAEALWPCGLGPLSLRGEVARDIPRRAALGSPCSPPTSFADRPCHQRYEERRGFGSNRTGVSNNRPYGGGPERQIGVNITPIRCKSTNQ